MLKLAAQNLALALASAALLILIFPRFEIFWLAPVALTPLLIAMAREPRPARRFLLGWMAGMVYWFGVCYWIQFVLAVHGGVGQVLGWALLLLFCAAKSIHLAVFAMLAGIFMRRWWAAPAVAALWVAIEVTHGPLGFAWLTLGNAGLSMGVPMRLAPYTGVYGISFVFALMATVVALVVLRRPRLQLAWILLLPLVALLPRLPEAERGRETALLIQPNLSESENWTPETVDRMHRRLAEVTTRSALSSVEHPPSLVIWPEVPAPLYYDQDERFRGYVNELARRIRAYLLIGVVAHTRSGAPLNSALLISPDGVPLNRYDKVHLVPFGEFVPWPLGFAETISTEVGNFAAGDRVVVTSAGGHRIGSFICYESVFPNFVRKFAAGGAEVLINISNDGWFGRSAAREQHLSIVRMRAAENKRWILRSTNNGITATIDSAGRLRGTLPPFVEAASFAGFDYIHDKTFYTRFGDWFAWVCATIVVMGLVAERLAPQR